MSKPIFVGAVFLDAVGTVLDPCPTVRRAYWEAGRRHGHDASEQEIGLRFNRVFREQESQDRAKGLRTDEHREEQRWRGIVSATLPGLPDPDACYRELHDHFAQADSWRLLPGAVELLALLDELGIVGGIASNFDSRLHGIIQNSQLRRQVRHTVVSSEIGWRKPAPEFFLHLCEITGLPAQNILMVGDDQENDVTGPRRIGMPSILVAPRSPSGNAPDLAGLAEMIRLEQIVPLRQLQSSRAN
ncbi:MAG: HAD-IA family hydrolase [Planctomycetota bacterium]